MGKRESGLIPPVSGGISPTLSYRLAEMKSLQCETDCENTLGRVDSVTESDAALWGRMNVTQMLRHVADAMLVPLGEMHSRVTPTWVGRVIVKPAALKFPLRWSKGLPTLPEIDQCRLGQPPGDFAEQRDRVRELLVQLRAANTTGQVHPFFGPMLTSEWLRWGWLHADHHLRQFGR